MPKVILAGRRLNDSMAHFLAEQAVADLTAQEVTLSAATMSILWLIFKEDCADLRHSTVFGVISILDGDSLRVALHDPHAKGLEVQREYNRKFLARFDFPRADALILTVLHREYLEKTVADL